MKKSFIMIYIGCLLYLSANAQNQHKYFLKKDGTYSSFIDSAEYTRVVKDPVNGSRLYTIEEFYRNGKKKSIGYSRTINPINYQGEYQSFFKNGKLYAVINYEWADEAYRKNVRTVQNSAGKVLVKEGSGYAIFYDDGFDYVLEQGNIKNGLYDGKWTGELRSKDDTLKYKEIYANGKLISGESTDRTGKVYPYTAQEIKPTFRGGEIEFRRSLLRNTRYPRDMQTQDIQGTVNVEFVISSTGDVIDIRASNAESIHPALVTEAIRAVKLTTGWIPGVKKGRNVDSPYKASVSFNSGG